VETPKNVKTRLVPYEQKRVFWIKTFGFLHRSATQDKGRIKNQSRK
jgi:hypothetical protein